MKKTPKPNQKANPKTPTKETTNILTRKVYHRFQEKAEAGQVLLKIMCEYFGTCCMCLPCTIQGMFTQGCCLYKKSEK